MYVRPCVPLSPQKCYNLAHQGSQGPEILVSHICRFSTVPAKASENTTFWRMKTTKSEKKEVTSVNNEPKEECPLVWRKWDKDLALKALNSMYHFLFLLQILRSLKNLKGNFGKKRKNYPRCVIYRTVAGKKTLRKNMQDRSTYFCLHFFY